MALIGKNDQGFVKNEKKIETEVSMFFFFINYVSILYFNFFGIKRDVFFMVGTPIRLLLGPIMCH